MNEFKSARDQYESTPIPEELNDHVLAGIRRERPGAGPEGMPSAARWEPRPHALWWSWAG